MGGKVGIGLGGGVSIDPFGSPPEADKYIDLNNKYKEAKEAGVPDDLNPYSKNSSFKCDTGSYKGYNFSAGIDLPFVKIGPEESMGVMRKGNKIGNYQNNNKLLSFNTSISLGIGVFGGYEFGKIKYW